MLKIKRLTLLIGLLGCQLYLFAVGSESLNNQIIDVRSGLAHNSVQSIIQDKYGFIWFGTLNGLTRFDGYSLVNYRASATDSSTIYNNRISLIYLDANKDLWVSAFDTVVCKYNYDTNDFTRYNASDLSKDLLDSTNKFINRSRLYAQGLGKEFSIDDNKFMKIRDLESGDLMSLDDFLDVHFKKQYFNCIYLDKTNVLWIGTNYNGVVKVNLMANPFRSVPFIIVGKSGLESTAIRCIYKDEEKLWLGALENGLSIIDSKSDFVDRFTMDSSIGQSIANDKVRIIYKDSIGDVWIGCNSGMTKFNERTKQFQQYTEPGFMTRYDKNAWKKTHTLPNRNYQSIEEDYANNLLFGTYNSIFKYNRKTDTFKYNDLSSFANNSLISCIYSDSEKKSLDRK